MQRIAAGTSVERIEPFATKEQIVFIVARKVVVLRTTDDILERPEQGYVVGWIAGHILRRARDAQIQSDPVRSIRKVQRVVPTGPFLGEELVTEAANEILVVAQAAHDRIVTIGRDQCIIAATTADEIVVPASHQPVGSLTANQSVVACIAIGRQALGNCRIGLDSIVATLRRHDDPLVVGNRSHHGCVHGDRRFIGHRRWID